MVAWNKLADIAHDVNSQKISAIENIERSLDLIKNHADDQSIISSLDDRAKQKAAEVDSRIKAGKSGGRLAGVPFIAKDNFLITSGQTTAASNILKGFEAPYTATAIARLESEGAICVAKANMDAFAHGSSTENSDFFVTKNPHDKTRVPGGSSGGSSAAVVLGLAPFALGTDTGGSIRQPAAFSGCVGYKPTYGLVSRSGVIAMASSTDVIGPLSRSVEDSALVLDIMAGKDPLDSTTIACDKRGYTKLEASLKGKKIAVIKEHVAAGLDEGVRQSFNSAVAKLEAAGAKVEQVSLPSLSLALAVYYIICPAEVSSNLARYDGQRYGHSAVGAKDLQESYELSREQGFGAEAKRRIMIGSHVLSSGYYDAYYKKAQTVRTKIINELAEAFNKYDLLVGPTTPTTAFKIGEKSGDPLQMYLSDILTVGANIAGSPSISIPAGEVGGLPVGFQITGPLGGDYDLLAAAKAFEELL